MDTEVNHHVGKDSKCFKMNLHNQHSLIITITTVLLGNVFFFYSLLTEYDCK